MNKILLLFFTLAVATQFNTALALGETIYLSCKYSHSVDTQGKTTEISGADFITVIFDENGFARIEKKDLTGMLGDVTDSKINGKSTYDLNGLNLTQTLLINRYTGDFENSYDAKGKNAKIIFYGKCTRASKKLF